MLVKFRAECQRDVDRFLEILPSHYLVSYKITKQEIEKVRIPDVDCEIEVRDMTIPDLVDLMSHITDTHVMQQTIALAENYTGIRDYQDYDENHLKRHLLLHRFLLEVVSDYSIQSDKRIRDTTVLDLLTWSYQQTKEPTLVE
jgi:hypothetical protein